MVKMVVSDFWGTLIDREEAIPLSTMLELDRVRKMGVIFSVTTSNSAKRIAEYNHDFPFIDYIVAFNGSYVYDLVRDKVLYKKGLSVTVIKKIIKMFGKYDLAFYTEDYCNYTGKYKDEYFSEALIDIDNFLVENKKNIYKIKIYFENGKVANAAYKEVCSKIEACCFIKRENDYYILEVTNNSDTKLTGVMKIAKKNKFDIEDVLVIASSPSSLELIKNVGVGICVSNADAKVKKVAKEVTLSNEEKGVEQILKKYF